MKLIPYIIAAAVIAWAVFSLVKHFKNRKKKGGCGECGGCDGCQFRGKNPQCGSDKEQNPCRTCDRSKK